VPLRWVNRGEAGAEVCDAVFEALGLDDDEDGD
jgi:hypothetical protein